MTRTATDTGPEPLFVSPLEAGRLLGVSRSHVYDLIARGALASARDGRRRLVVLSSVREYAESLPRGA